MIKRFALLALGISACAGLLPPAQEPCTDATPSVSGAELSPAVDAARESYIARKTLREAFCTSADANAGYCQAAAAEQAIERDRLNTLIDLSNKVND